VFQINNFTKVVIQKNPVKNLRGLKARATLKILSPINLKNHKTRVSMNKRTCKSSILIVDDDKISLKILSEFLGNKGFNVLVAENSKECFQITQNAQPDLILLDVLMPGSLSGFEVCQRLKSEKPTRDIPVIFMTSLTETVDKVKGFELGGGDYITKPFEYQELLARVKTHLSVRQLQQELRQSVEIERSRSQKLEAAQQKVHRLLEQTIKQSHNTEVLEKYQTVLKKREMELETVDSLAHRLKNVLNAITTLSTRLSKDCSYLKPLINAGALNSLQQITETEVKMVNLVEGLELLVEFFLEKPVEFELLEMSDIVTKVIEKRLAHEIKQYQAQIKLADIWPTIPGHQPWLEEVWMNYISNGLKYGGKPPHLELGATPLHHEKVRFWIRDNGQGLTPAEQAKLFTAKNNPQPVCTDGKGFGLCLVQQLVEKMDGEVGVESRKGKGSLFYFTLPAYIKYP
jgi:two-component system, sensor histidine kinase and response regulator